MLRQPQECHRLPQPKSSVRAPTGRRSRCPTSTPCPRLAPIQPECPLPFRIASLAGSRLPWQPTPMARRLRGALTAGCGGRAGVIGRRESTRNGLAHTSRHGGSAAVSASTWPCVPRSRRNPAPLFCALVRLGALFARRSAVRLPRFIHAPSPAHLGRPFVAHVSP